MTDPKKIDSIEKWKKKPVILLIYLTLSCTVFRGEETRTLRLQIRLRPFSDLGSLNMGVPNQVISRIILPMDAVPVEQEDWPLIVYVGTNSTYVAVWMCGSPGKIFCLTPR